jgi:hypothetical protein
MRVKGDCPLMLLPHWGREGVILAISTRSQKTRGIFYRAKISKQSGDQTGDRRRDSSDLIRLLKIWVLLTYLFFVIVRVSPREY